MRGTNVPYPPPPQSRPFRLELKVGHCYDREVLLPSLQYITQAFQEQMRVLCAGDDVSEERQMESGLTPNRNPLPSTHTPTRACAGRCQASTYGIFLPHAYATANAILV